MSKRSILISINVTAHREGPLLRPTLLSIGLLVDRFKKKYPQKQVEINIGLDSPDQLSKQVVLDYAHRSAFDVNVFENNFGDPAHNRNFLITKSSGMYIVFHDADDLFSDDYLVMAYAQAIKIGRPCVVTPAFVIPFDENKINYIQKYYGTTSPYFVKSSFFSSNSFISENLVHREIYDAIGYESNVEPYGYEDWHWNTEVIAKGYDFFPAEGTLFFYRLKNSTESIRLKAKSRSAIIRRSSLFEPNKYAELTHIPYDAYTPLPVSYAITEEPTVVVELPKEELQKTPFTTQVVTGVRVLAQSNFNTEKRPYRFFAYQYRSIQQLLSPITIWTRSNNNVVQFLRHQRKSFSTLLLTPTVRETTTKVDEPDAVTNANTQLSLTQRNKRRLLDLGIGERQLKNWRKLNEIENNIIYSDHLLANLTVFNNTSVTPLDDVYYRFCVEYRERGITDIVLMPHIQVGGADNAMIHLVKELRGLGRKPLVITTEVGNHSPAAPKIKKIKGVYHFDLGSTALELQEQDRVLFLGRVLQHWSIQTLTIMNSMTGYRLLNEYGPMVADYTSARIFLFSKGRNLSGMTHEYFPLRRAWPFVEKIITDSFTFSNQLASYYGWPQSKQLTCPLPVDQVSIKEKTTGIAKRILFMARLASEKQVDVLLKVAKKLAPHGIMIDIYGIKTEPYCGDIRFDQRVQSLHNVTFMGAVSSYEDIDVDIYDMLLMTSLYEGIPITLLDSLKANLFVVSSGVGGIREEIINGGNGFIVEDSSSVEEYVKNILNFYKAKDLHNLAARKEVNSVCVARHSLRAFSELIKEAYAERKENRG